MELIRDHEHNEFYKERKCNAENEFLDATGVTVNSEVGLQKALVKAMKYGDYDEKAWLFIRMADWVHARNELHERK